MATSRACTTTPNPEEISSEIKSFLQLILDIQTLTASLILLPNNNTNQSESNTRIELLFYTMQMLSLGLLSDDQTSIQTVKSELVKQFKGLILNESRRSDWLRMLLLIENNNSTFRHEASVWIYRLCILEQYQYNTNQQDSAGSYPCLLNIILKELLGLLDMVVKLKPSDYEFFNCKDYLMLIANLILNMDTDISDKVVSRLDVTDKEPIKVMGMNELMIYIANQLKVMNIKIFFVDK